MQRPARSWSIVVTGAIAIAAAVGIGLLLGADVIAHGDAAGHVRYHAMTVLVILVLATLLARRADGSGRSMAPAVGLLLLAAAQLVEAVGGAGFDANNASRNGLAVIHDLGMALTVPGLVAAVLGMAIGLQDWLARRGMSRAMALGGGVAILGVGLFVVKTVIGL